jgi:hypothetical protein
MSKYILNSILILYIVIAALMLLLGSQQSVLLIFLSIFLLGSLKFIRDFIANHNNSSGIERIGLFMKLILGIFWLIMIFSTLIENFPHGNIK